MESSTSSAGTSRDVASRNVESRDVRILGVLSDTHDRVEAAAAGIAALRIAGAQFLVHCGDVGGQRVVDLFAGIPAALVWGNTDFDRASLGRYAAELGLRCGNFLELEFSGKRIAATHGDDPKLLRRAIDPPRRYDFLLLGHTHVPLVQQADGLCVVNPGALHRAAKKTVAAMDLQTGGVRHIVVEV